MKQDRSLEKEVKGTQLKRECGTLYERGGFFQTGERRDASLKPFSPLALKMEHASETALELENDRASCKVLQLHTSAYDLHAFCRLWSLSRAHTQSAKVSYSKACIIKYVETCILVAIQPPPQSV